MKGAYYKKIDANKLRQRQVWEVLTRRRIDKLNEGILLGTSKDIYELGYRGRNHSIVLLCNDSVVARGIMQINSHLDLIEGFKKLW